MAAPNSKATLKEYALRQLGKPVLDINVDDDQLDDIIDDALQYFAEYHYDGTIRTYLKHKINDNDLANQKSNASMGQSTTGTHISSNMTFEEGQGYIVLPESVYSVLRIFPFVDKSGLNMFDLRYQLRLNDLYDISSTSIVQYEMVQNHIQLLDEILIGQVPVRFNKAQNRLYLDMDWSAAVTSGEYIIIDWKTSKKINKVSYKYKTGTHEISKNIMDCNFSHYSLQLSLYRYILEEYYNLKIRNQVVAHLKDDGVDAHLAPYLKRDIINMLENGLS